MEEERGTPGSINLRQIGKEEPMNLSGQVHHLPCCIKFNGPCSVSQYFKPKLKGMEVDGLAVEEAHFRGRNLQGTTLSLPNGYSGFVLGKNKSGKRKACDASSEGKSNNWETKAKFDELTYWNHDSPPSKDNPFLRSFHWFAVAEAVSFPIIYVCVREGKEIFINTNYFSPNSSLYDHGHGTKAIVCIWSERNSLVQFIQNCFHY